MSLLASIVGFAALAGTGATLRWWAASRHNDAANGRSLPWGTIEVNLVASFLLGLVHNLDGRWAWLVGVAFCGALSTFSTFVLELVVLSDNHERRQAIVCLGLSIGGGLLAAWLGLALAN